MSLAPRVLVNIFSIYIYMCFDFGLGEALERLFVADDKGVAIRSVFKFQKARRLKVEYH